MKLIQDGGNRGERNEYVYIQLCANSTPRPRGSVDEGKETTLSAAGPSSGSKGQTRQNTRIFPFEFLYIQIYKNT
jgi:hypothetical protein